MSPMARPETGLAGLDGLDGPDYLIVPPPQGFVPPQLAHLYGTMQNPDPTSEFMYQLPRPVEGEGLEGNKEGEQAGQSVPLDVKALHHRLQTLGLNPSSESILTTTQNQPVAVHQSALSSAQPFSPWSASNDNPNPNPNPNPNLGSAFQPHQYHPLPAPAQHHYPTVTDLRPQDSISMYRPYRGPAPASMRSSRRGGTDVDRAPGEEFGIEYEEYTGDDFDQRSRGTRGGWETVNPPESDAPSVERLTLSPSEWTTGTYAGGMYGLRDRLLQAQAAQNSEAQHELSQYQNEASRLAAAIAKLEGAEDQLCTLQATLIAERVARTQIERDAKNEADSMRDCKTELAGAIRALRRARDEGKKTEEERRKIARAFEETKVQLYRYHEELKVRDARAKGREEGRAEAWQEAERWMGGSPPIPVDRVQSLPAAVLQQTPMMQPSQPLAQPQGTYLPPNGQMPQQQGGFQTGPTPAPMHYQPQLGQQQQQHQHQQQQQQAIPPTLYQQPVPQQYVSPPAQAQGPSPPLNMPQPVRNVTPPYQPGQAPRQTMAQSAQFQTPTAPPSRVSPPQVQSQYAQSTAPLQQQHTATTLAAPPIVVVPPTQIVQPVMVPMPFPGQPGVPSTGPTQHAPQSVPHPSSALPTQPPTRAGTVAGYPSHPQPTLPSTTFQPPHPESVVRPHAADSFLDRVDHDPRFQQMLAGAPTRTVHTSAVPQSAAPSVNRNPSHSMGRSQVDLPEKPLPVPGVARAQTIRAPSNAGTNVTSGRPRRRFSLMEGLHAHSHSQSHLGDGDRYPVFPGAGGRGHSRQSSFTSADPAQYALPPSVDPSVMQTPMADPDRALTGRGSQRTTPSKSAKARSRVAGALRADTEIGDGELSNIDEAEEVEVSRVMPSMTSQRPPASVPSHHASQQSISHHTPHGAGFQRYAPSMPPMRPRPMPRMPAPLGGKPGSEPHYDPRQNRQHIAQMYGRDLAAALTDRLPEPESAYDVPRSHPLFVPPGLASQAVSGSVEDVQGPRISALGLEGMEEYDPNQGMGTGAGAGTGTGGPGTPARTARTAGTGTGAQSMKAPTSSRSNNVSAQNARPPSTIAPSRAPAPESQLADPTPITPRGPTSAAPTKRQTTIVTEYYDPPAARSVQPHKVPLPPSRSRAPTAYTHSPARTLLSPTETQRSYPRSKAAPSINIIDYAMRQPLPASRPTTIIEPQRLVSVATEVDHEDPDRNSRRQQSSISTRAMRRKPVSDPRQIPLPASRAPTHRAKASTYAGTVATIEEVTEEEPGKENRSRRV